MNNVTYPRSKEPEVGGCVASGGGVEDHESQSLPEKKYLAHENRCF